MTFGEIVLRTKVGSFIYFYFVPMSVCLHVGMCPVCAVPTKIRRGHWTSLKWSYRQLWVAMWVLGIESEPSGRAVSTFNHLSSLESSFLKLLERTMGQHFTDPQNKGALCFAYGISIDFQELLIECQARWTCGITDELVIVRNDQNLIHMFNIQ